MLKGPWVGQRQGKAKQGRMSFAREGDTTAATVQVCEWE